MLQIKADMQEQLSTAQHSSAAATQVRCFVFSCKPASQIQCMLISQSIMATEECDAHTPYKSKPLCKLPKGLMLDN